MTNFYVAKYFFQCIYRKYFREIYPMNILSRSQNFDFIFDEIHLTNNLTRKNSVNGCKIKSKYNNIVLYDI